MKADRIVLQLPEEEKFGMSRFRLPWEQEKRTKKMWVGVEPTLFRVLKERAEELHHPSVSEYLRKLAIDDVLYGAVKKRRTA